MPSTVEKLANKKTYIENCLPEQYSQIPTDGIKSELNYYITHFYHMLPLFLVVIFTFRDTRITQEQRKTK